MNKIKPLKKFGQNYLRDENIINKIVNEISPSIDDTILEIGPGRGALTSKLSETCRTLNAVEIDNRVIEDLSGRFSNLNIINKDFLKFDLQKETGWENIRIAGNIPYNITSPILFKLIDNYKKIEDAVLMIQDEVARRITANVGTKEYGILSVVLNYFCEVKYCFKVSPNCFYPKPKVNSAVIHVYFNKEIPSNYKTFIKVVKASFGNRRKTLKNSLSNSIFSSCNLADLPIDGRKRAEQLDIKDYIELTNYFERQLRNE